MKRLLLLLSIIIAMVAHAKADNFVTDVMVIGGTQDETNSLKAQYQNQGWTVVNQNLNQGAGGDYIYLLYKTDTDANPDATFISDFAWAANYNEQLVNPSCIYYPVAYDGGSQFMASQGNLNSGTNGSSIYLYYTKDANGGTENPHIVKSITFSNSPEGSIPYYMDFNSGCGGNAPEIYMHPDITQGWIFWQCSPTECMITAYDGPKAWITSYTVPEIHDGLNVIAADVFDGFINLEELIFPYVSNVTQMPSMQGCTKLKHVNVRRSISVDQDQTPTSITSIPDNAFVGTAIEELTMPSVTQVGAYAFEGCNLSSVTFSANFNQSGGQIGNGAFANISGNCTVNYSGSVNDWSPNAYVYSPNLVVNASNGACGWCGGTGGTSENNLYWTLANGHLTIDWLWPGSPEQQVISSHNWDEVTYVVYSLTLNHVYYVGVAFQNHTTLTTVTIGDGVTSIGNQAFYGCTGLTSLTIGNSVTSIGSFAFEDCTGLTSLTIGNSVTSIGNKAFYDCTGLTSVHISDLAAWCNISFGNRMTNPLYNAHHLYLNDNEITDLVIPNSVTSIGQYAFSGCIGLTSVTIPNSVTSIDELAFGGCSNITSVNINSNAILSESSSLKNIFGSQVTNYTIGNDVTSIGEHAFYGCSGLTSITIPNSVTSIGESAFWGCTGLTSLTIGNSVTSIGWYAFRFCSSLKDLYFDGTKAQWNNVTKGLHWNSDVSSDYKEHWRCTVTFNANGHGTAPAPQTNLWSKESKATQPAAPTEAGYVFTSWYTDAQCTTPWNFSTDIVPDDMTLYAGWDLEVQELQGSGTAEDPYLISNNGEWIWFAQSVTNGTTYAGQTVKLAADITATVMAGTHSSEINYHAFSGTFDGDGHTITLALSGSGEGTALFSDLNGATLKNLKTQGTVTTNDRRPATFAIIVFGNSTITNCWSTVAVSSTRTSGWIDGGGFVGRVSSNATLNMTDCAFHGSVTFTNGATTGGGMIGYTQNNATVNLTNCLYSPTSLTLNVSQYNPRIFVSGQESGNLTNCYYNAVAAASVLANQGTDASDMTNEELVAALGPNWTITDGLVVPKWIRTFTKAIAAYYTENGVNYGWNLIASPVGTVNLTDVPHLFDNQYDLYYFDQTGGDNGKEWKNRKAHPDTFTTFASSHGYLYANSGDVTLMFTGVPYSGSGEVTLTKADGFTFSGWNLIGNPFGTAKTIGSKPFYRMNDLGSEIIAATDPTIAAMEGIFVVATEDGETVTFAEPTKNRGSEERVIINLCNSTAAVIDRAIVRLGEGETLPKLQIRKGSTKVYIPQDGEDYAIANAEPTGEIPVNFKASENGSYTLTVNTEGQELSYLHLIDNLTGADIDMLHPETLIAGEDPQSPMPTYTFQAKTTDYASRFRLVFASVCEDADGDNAFAFISNGNIIVNGTGSLQIFDALGRQVFTKELSTVNSQLSTANFSVGVYVLRLIEGDDVRTQKIVIE